MSMLEEGAIVLVHDVVQGDNMSRRSKIAFRWLGLYRIQQADQEKGTYLLQELDSMLLAGTFAGNRLKKFIQREGVMISADDISNHISESPDPVFNPAARLNLNDFDRDSDRLPKPI